MKNRLIVKSSGQSKSQKKNKLLLIALLSGVLLVGCLNNSPSNNESGKQAALETESSVDLASLDKPIEIVVGNKSVIMYRTSDGLEVLETVHPKGETPLLSEEMEGLTWKKIVEQIAPQSRLSAEYENMVYTGVKLEGSSSELNVQNTLIEPSDSPKPMRLSKTSVDGGWFQGYFCGTGNCNGWCLLNQWGVYRSTGSTNCMFSRLNIVLNSGSLIYIKIKVGSKIFSPITIPANNSVYSYNTRSSKNWTGVYNKELHSYELISADANNNWHWGVVANTF
jgi:hypothetical protein